MRRAWSTTRRARRPQTARVSLFPFLAVLLCTMGALILLLVVIARQARLQAAQATRRAQAEVTETEDEVKTACELVRWRIDQLKQSRKKTVAQLSDARLNLGQAEDHVRRLAAEVAELEAALADLDRLASEGSRQREELESEAAWLGAEIAKAKAELEEARQQAQSRRRSYAVVPYHGRHQTSQRPIYLECTAEAVILQPEGVVLRAEDFDGPMGPGNPLAAALRAKREYLLDHGQIDPQKTGEPYPLLLVRPQGIEAYYAARSAMQSWASDFGYELIGDDWKLSYEPRDAELARAMRTAVEIARVQQTRLAAAAPRHYGHGQGRVRYRVSPTGGIVRDGLLPGEGDIDDSPGRGPGSLSAGQRFGSGAGGEGNGDGPGGPGEDRGGGWSDADKSYGLYGNSAVPGGSGTDADGNLAAGQTGSGNAGPRSADREVLPYGPVSSGADAAAEPSYGTAGNTAQGSSPSPFGAAESGTPGSGTPGSGTPGSADSDFAAAGSYRPGTVGGMATGNATSPMGTPGSGATMAGSPGAGTPGAAAAGSATPGAQSISLGNPMPEGMVAGQPPREAAGVPGGTPLRPGEWRPPAEQPGGRVASDSETTASHHRPRRMAESRGRNWGLPTASGSAVPIARPIRIACYPDRLILVPGEGTAGGRTIALTNRTEDSVDELVSAVWRHMESWGIAGEGMYWRPVLRVHAAPGAESRLEDLQTLLDGSGLTVEGN